MCLSVWPTFGGRCNHALEVLARGSAWIYFHYPESLVSLGKEQAERASVQRTPAKNIIHEEPSGAGREGWFEQQTGLLDRPGLSAGGLTH